MEKINLKWFDYASIIVALFIILTMILSLNILGIVLVIGFLGWDWRHMSWKDIENKWRTCLYWAVIINLISFGIVQIIAPISISEFSRAEQIAAFTQLFLLILIQSFVLYIIFNGLDKLIYVIKKIRSN